MTFRNSEAPSIHISKALAKINFTHQLTDFLIDASEFCATFVIVYKILKNEHQDKTVILMSIAFSTLNYIVYIPELVMVISSSDALFNHEQLKYPPI